MIDFCRFQSEFFKTSSEKFNHDFNYENRHSGTGYIEKAVFVPCRFQSWFQSRFQLRFSAQWNSPFKDANFAAFCRSDCLNGPHRTSNNVDEPTAEHRRNFSRWCLPLTLWFREKVPYQRRQTARRPASRQTCYKQRWTLTVINLRPN